VDVVVSDPGGGQQTEGRERVEIKQQSGTEYGVLPGGSEHEAQCGDDRDGEKGHVVSKLTKTLKGNSECEIGILSALQNRFVAKQWNSYVSCTMNFQKRESGGN
jgi:hypothetical protein